MAVAERAVAETRPDRTSELRKKGYEGRRLGPRQMTTDTAVRVTRLVIEEKGKLLKQIFVRLYRLVTVPLDQIPYIDFPELRINKNESTEMPFRYVKGNTGEPIMPQVRH